MPRARPFSYSENDIHLPRLESFFVELPSSPTRKSPTLHPILKYALHWSFHLSLIAMFETLFFWQFVSPSEDAALVNLIGNYTHGIFQTCANLTSEQQQSLRTLFGLFINQSVVDRIGTSALSSRNVYNWILLRNSWLYFVGITSIFLLIGATIYYKKKPMQWHIFLLENFALIVMLGLYEWMFFQTVVFSYKSVSIPELDKMITDKFVNQC